MAVKHYDIVIAGGAMAGATLALALDKLSEGRFSVAVIEPFKADGASHPGFDSRSIALSYGTVNILDSLGLWSGLCQNASAIRQIHVSDKGHAGMTEISACDYEVDALGYVVELADAGRFYHKALAQSDSIDFLCPDSLISAEAGIDEYKVGLESGLELSCKLFIAADGATSHCCQLAGLVNIEHDFGQVAVIANVRVDQPHQGQAFERFTKSGPVALLPMTQDRMSLVWCLYPENASQMLECSDSEFISCLQEAFGWRLGQVTQVGTRAGYPLILKEKERVIAHRFAVVGNAAQTLHPIAGQGFNLGIRDVMSLAEELAVSDDPGSYKTLSRYKKRREKDRRATIDLTAGLVQLFSNESFPLVAGRNLSLMAMDNIPLLKAPLLRRTMGLVER